MSIARLERVTGMGLTPHACVLCAGNPVDELTGKQKDAVFAPGVDVNWGNSVYICEECVDVIAELFGRVSEEDHSLLLVKHADLAAEFEKLQATNERLENLLKKAVEGKRAEDKIRKRVAA